MMTSATEFGIDMSTLMTPGDRGATEAFLFDLAGEYVKANGVGVRRIEAEMTEVMGCLASGVLPW